MESTVSTSAMLATDARDARDEPVHASVLVGEIASQNGFDPKPVIDSMKLGFVACSDQARATTGSLRGKLTLRIQVNEAGAVVDTQAEPGGSADNPALVACLAAVLAQARFPKPGGMATIFAPLVFRPKAVSR